MAVLHLGSGSSDLSNRLRELLSSSNYQDNSRDTPGSAIVLNVDFAASAIEIGRRREREEFGDDTHAESMRWAVVDILNWTAFKRACDEHCGKGKKFKLIVEKSCTDALACGADIHLGPFATDAPDGPGALVPQELHLQSFSPEAAVAIYLAAVTQSGGAWIALSYSAERFDFLRDSKQPAGALWSVEKVQRVVANDSRVDVGHGGTVYRPEIVHFVYTIRRNVY